MNSTVAPLPSELERLVDDFEAAQQRGRADLGRFLPPPGHPHRAAALRELIRIDLDYGWSRGAPTAREEYLARFPELADDASALAAISFEEFRQRRQADEEPPGTVRVEAATAEADRDEPPTAAGAVEVFHEIQRSDLLAHQRYADAMTALPEVGQEFLGFRLVDELGRGAFGRVFLAQQVGLADRPVALKVATELLGESQTLASLQHTHIMPIYSAHRAGPVQALCMPFFGRTTLGDVLKEVRGRPSLPTSGRSIVSTLHNRRGSTLVRSEETAATTTPAEPHTATDVALEDLARRPYVGAVLWLGSQLADGLQHAHERGVVHRDLKPANVLIADDGRPMLLDFNLSDDTRLRGTAAGSSVGGTLPYMAPEQLRAFLPAGDPRAVDARSDLYSLGLILFELLTGHAAFAAKLGTGSTALDAMIAERLQPPPRLRRYNPDVTPATEAIVRRCLEPDPARRYQSARQLQDDLDAQLADKPLVHAAEPWGRERLAKWARRHPRLSSATSVTLLASLALGAVGVCAFELHQKSRRLESQDAVRAFEAAADAVQADLVRAPDADTRGRALERAHAAVAPLAADGRDLALDNDARARLRGRLGEVLFLMANATAADKHAAGPALALNERAGGLYAADAVPQTLLRQRSKLLREIGDKVAAADWSKRADATAARTAQDRYFAAVALAERGEFAKAAAEAEDATRLDPRHVWAWFLLGHCRFHAGRDTEALSAFDVCVNLNDRLAPAYANRGRVNFRARRYAAAAHDFDRALALADDTAVRIDRALARSHLDDLNGAEADLSDALAKPDAPTRAYFQRANVRERRGDGAGATTDRAEGLRREPTDPLSWVSRGLARFDAKDAEGALADFTKAEGLNPRLYSALQNRAFVNDALGRNEASLAAIDRLLSFYPQLPDALATRAVLLARLGRTTEALVQAEACLAQNPAAGVRYQLSGAFARAGDAKRAMQLVGRALLDGAGSDDIATDPDLDPVRSRPEFKRLLTAVQVLREASGAR